MARAGGRGQWADVTIRVALSGDEQRRILSGLLGRPLRPETSSVGIRLEELDRVLSQVGDGWDLAATVQAVAGPLPDRVGEAAARQAAIASALDTARRAGPPAEWFARWLGDVAADGTAGRLHSRGDLDSLVTVAHVLARLPADGLPLPVLATEVTGDTKALGRGPLAALALRAVAAWQGEAPPRTAGERRALWESVGVVPDDLASQVLVLGLPAAASGMLGSWLHEAASHGVPFRVTLHQLQLSPLDIGEAQPVHVCENPAVLRVAAERLGPASLPLVCTEGRPSVACNRLLDTLAAFRCSLRYHGDFDWPGLRIAADVLSRPGAGPWRYSTADYVDAVERLGRLSVRSRLAGAPAPSPWDPELARAMTRHDSVVYEEDVLATLVEDLRRS